MFFAFSATPQVNAAPTMLTRIQFRTRRAAFYAHCRQVMLILQERKRGGCRAIL
jgi:hypothetical protein